jgi:O-methyltransferase involved in polyketide biosynthesis
VEASVRAVAEYSGEGSWFALTYLDERAIHAPRGDAKLTATLVSRVGEPYRFGFKPELVPRWLAERGFALLSDETDAALVERYLTDASLAGFYPRRERHIALAQRT